MSESHPLLSGVVDNAGYPYPLGPYLLLANMGRGGMGAVHLAKHGNVAGIEKYCVIKTLKRSFTMDDEYILRFVDEARLVVHLTHRNICPVFDVGRVKDRYFIAMELVSGTDVSIMMERARGLGSRLPDDVALHVATEMLEGLAYAHRLTNPVTGQPLNLVHRDVSPQNVLISFEGEVKLIDFGVAASAMKAQKTDPNVVMGKLAYMSREHLTGEAVDGRHDLLAVAVMLYEMLTGFPYYENMEKMAVFDAITTGRYVPPRMGAIDPALQPILARALEQDRDRRTPSCEELKEELTRYMMQKQLATSTRALRNLVAQLCPGEQEAMRAHIARFRDLVPPKHPAAESDPALKPPSASLPEPDNPWESGAVHIALNPSNEHSAVLDAAPVEASDAIYRPDAKTGEVPVQRGEPLEREGVTWKAGPQTPRPMDDGYDTSPTARQRNPNRPMPTSGEHAEATMRIQRAPGKRKAGTIEETMVVPRAPGKAVEADSAKKWWAAAVAIAVAWVLLGVLVWFVLADDAPAQTAEEPAALPPPAAETLPPLPAATDPLTDRVRWLTEHCDKACSGRVQAAWENKKNRRGRRAKKLSGEANSCLEECAP